MLTQSQFSQVQFSAALANIKYFYSSLKAIQFQENVSISISDEGFRATVEDSKSVQATFYASRECFTEFSLKDNEPILMCVPISVICDCLGIFVGTESTMKLLYKGNGAPLVFILEQHGDDDLITECAIKTKNVEAPLDFMLDSSDPGYNVIVLNGSQFAHLLYDLNSKDVEWMEILMSPKPPYFRMTALGVMQTLSNVEVDRLSDSVLMFSCKQTTVTKYNMSYIRLLFKALTLSNKVAIRTDNSGLLNIQLATFNVDNAQAYIEYYISALVDDDFLL